MDTPNELMRLLQEIGPEPTLQEIDIPGVELTYTGLVITDPELPFAVYTRIVLASGLFKAATSFWIGDLQNLGEKLYGDRYIDAMEATGLSYDTLTNYASVCRKVPKSRRRPELRFGHHAEVASLEPHEQIEWLDAAVVNGWSRQDLRGRLRDAKPQPAIEQPGWSDDAPVSSEPLSAEKVEEAETDARKTLERSLPPGHPLWETRAKTHARDVVALAQTAKLSLREAAARLVEKAQPNGTGVWVPKEAFEEFAAAFAADEE